MSTTIDDETTWLVEALAKDPQASEAAVGLMVERLRRLEEAARLEGASRQMLQRLMSARRVLGDRVDLASAGTRYAPD